MNKTKFELAIDFIKNCFETNNYLYCSYAYNVYLVGGCVRDELMGLPIKDIDIMVDLPDGGIKFAKAMVNYYPHYCKNLVLFPRFGTSKFTITVCTKENDFEDVDIECVMPRGETYEGTSRKPVDVRYVPLREDAMRRDFTVNALYKAILTDKIIDPTERGIKDIENMVINTTGEAEFIFKEDPLRMLRAIRFASSKKFNIPHYVLLNIYQSAPSIKNISKERINDELSKILCSENVQVGFNLLLKSGLLNYIIFELAKCNYFVQKSIYHNMDVFNHIIKTVSQTKPILTHRLAALFHDIGKPFIYQEYVEDGRVIKRTFHGHIEKSVEIANKCLKDLKYSNDVINEVCFAIKHHGILKQFNDKNNELKITDKEVRKIHRNILPYIDTVLDLIDADNKSHHPDYCLPNQVIEFKTLIDKLKLKDVVVKLKVDGNDIMTHFNIKPGPEIKLYLESAQNFVDKCPEATKIEIINYLKTTYENV